jgi:glycine/D-amino acid oxidase-like deaminating enzyme
MQPSVWNDEAAATAHDELPPRVDDLVVGAGITGLVTALLLARAGCQVAVIDANDAGSGTTGRSSAKVSLLQGARLAEITRRHRPKVIDAYVEANREGQAWLLRFCEDHNVPFQRRRAVTFAAGPEDVPRLKAEYQAEQRVGLGSHWVQDLDVPFPVAAAITLEDQAQVDPLAVVHTLVAEVRRHGGVVCPGHRLVGLTTESDRVSVTLSDDTTLAAEHVVLATGTPVLDRGLHFAKLQAQRSYLLALSGATAPEGMFLSVGQPTVSIRDVPDRELVLVGGFGHVTGRGSPEHDHLDQLRTWARTYFPGSSEVSAWAAQDYASYDALPTAAVLPWSDARVHVATGYGKWGFTNGVAAALTIAADLLGTKPQWAETLSTAGGARAAVTLAGMNAAVGAQAICGVLRSVGPNTPTPPSACTHLGGKLRWNDEEMTWDCPLHGSRFQQTGRVIEGPARVALEPPVSRH